MTLSQVLLPDTETTWKKFFVKNASRAQKNLFSKLCERKSDPFKHFCCRKTPWFRKRERTHMTPITPWTLLYSARCIWVFESSQRRHAWKRHSKRGQGNMETGKNSCFRANIFKGLWLCPECNYKLLLQRRDKFIASVITLCGIYSLSSKVLYKYFMQLN